MVVTSMRMSADLERMGDLARHVAKVARLRYPDSAVPADIRATILQMGQVAERIVAKCGQVIAAKDVEDAKTLERDDDAMDELHRTLFSHLIDGTWKHGTEAAVEAPSSSRVPPITVMSWVAHVSTAAIAPKIGPTCMIRWCPRRRPIR